MSMTTIKNKSKKQYKSHLASRYKSKYNTKKVSPLANKIRNNKLFIINLFFNVV